MRESYTENGQLHQKLVVETSLKDPRSGDDRDRNKWMKLQNHLGALAANNFADFDTIEMHGRKT